MNSTNFAFVLPAVLIGLGLLVVVVVVVLVRRYERRRKEELESELYGLGFSFQEKDDSLLAGELGRLPVFGRGRRGRVRNVARRERSGREVVLFDYTYTVGGGQNSSTHRQTIAAVRSQERPVPDFELRPEIVFHKIGEMFGYQDIDFEDSPEFSNRYVLRGTDEEAIRRLFNPQVRRALETDSKWSIEGAGGWTIYFRHGKRIKPIDLATFLDQFRSIADFLLA
ncbi:MAG: hypothetical protein K8J08_12320 [Thermoanaerobaculia bacterium]|nr:hypothetical protein [Thermoanaerobaculia bacterium]